MLAVSSYFEGKKAELGALGYSRDKRPGKKQITWGVSTGINGIPGSLTRDINVSKLRRRMKLSTCIILRNCIGNR